MSKLVKPDAQIVVTIPRECEKGTVEALRAACDGIIAAMDAGEYTKRDDSPYGGRYTQTLYHFTRSVRFEVEPEPVPTPDAPNSAVPTVPDTLES